MDNVGYIFSAIIFGLMALVFFVLFIAFLIQSIERGKRIRELEKKLKDAKAQIQSMQAMGMPQYSQYQPQQPVQPVIYAQPVQQVHPAQPVQPAIPVQEPIQNTTPAVAAVNTVSAPAAPAYQTAPTPSWAMPAPAVQQPELITYTRQEPVKKPKREKFFSSINITFGIGVLLLTIVGATFMTGSWSWMTEEIRAMSLVILVFVVYGMSFLAGKVLKLQQTGFALYSLASLLGPIVIIGMGTFNLLGPVFSFKDGTGWLVATVAAAVLLATAIGGRFLFREEKTQTNIYRGTIYISLTWLVVFLSGQIGQASDGVNEWSMICLGLATLALAFRIVGLTKLLEDVAFFKVYSEIITYIPATLLLVSVFFSDGAIFGATIVEFAAFILLARFVKGRQWEKYLTPFVGIEIVISWIVFGDSIDEVYLVTAITILIVVILFAVHKALKLSTILSDILLPVALGSITAILAFEDAPVMGTVANFIAVVMVIFAIVIEPKLARIESLPEGIFRSRLPVPAQVSLSILGAVFYYIGITMIYFVPEDNPIKADLYFTILALVPAIAAIVLRSAWKDGINLKASGLTLAVISVIAGVFSIFSYGEYDRLGTILCSDIYICAWLLTLAVITLAVFFIVKPFKEKKLSVGVMFWLSVCLNALSIGVFLTIEYNASVVWRLKDIPSDYIPLIRQIAALVFLGLNMASVIAAFIIKRLGNGLIVKYAAGIKYFLCGFAMMWFSVAWFLYGSTWQLLIVAVIFAVLLSVFGSEFFALLPVIAAELSIMQELTAIENEDIRNVILVALAVIVAAAGHIIFRKFVISKKAIDYLSFTSFIFLFGLSEADYLLMVIFLALSLLVINFAGRTKIPNRIFVSIFASFVCFAIIAQPFFELPDVINLEYDIALLLGTLILICKVIKPAPSVALKYFWFTGVALSLIAEGISAAVTSEVLDLIVVATASFGIFIFAFIRRNRLWFILGIVSMVSVAVYLSLAFWSSLVWLIYLLIAGSILIVMAAINEWGKRHNKDGKKKRFFEEWTW